MIHDAAPPQNLAAEEMVLSAVLWGDVTAHEIELRARQLWAPEHGQLLAVLLSIEESGCRFDRGLGGGADLALIAAVMQHAFGESAPVTIRRLHEIMHRVPLWGWPGHRKTIEGYAARIRELHRQRQLIEGMQRVDAALRAGERPSARLLRWTARRLEQMAVDG